MHVSEAGNILHETYKEKTV